MFTSFYQIAKNTFREALREPIFLLVTLTALAIIGFFPVLTIYVFSAYEKLVIDSAMAVMMVFGWGLAIMISSYAISREIDNGTALLLLSKPVRRPVFIIAKIVGIMAATALFCVLTGIATLIALRISTDQFWIDNFMLYGYYVALVIAMAAAGAYNYITRSSFSMAAIIALLCVLPIMAIIGQFKPADGNHVGLAWRTVPALFLVLLSVVSMGTLATALSTRFALVPNLLLCAALFMLGLMSDYLIGRNAREQWFSVPPAGNEQLWVSTYTFAPQELAPIENWDTPRRLEEMGDFALWAVSTEAEVTLPVLGEDPAGAWKDGHGWVAKWDGKGATPKRLAIYNAAKENWRYFAIGDTAKKSRENGKNFSAIVFRRSDNPPRVPVGGTYLTPMPNAGNWFASAIYAAIPNWQLFWMADALSSRSQDAEVNTDEPTLPAAYVAYGLAYSVAMNLFLILLAVLLFWNREVGKQMT